MRAKLDELKTIQPKNWQGNELVFPINTESRQTQAPPQSSLKMCLNLLTDSYIFTFSAYYSTLNWLSLDHRGDPFYFGVKWFVVLYLDSDLTLVAKCV